MIKNKLFNTIYFFVVLLKKDFGQSIRYNVDE